MRNKPPCKDGETCERGLKLARNGDDASTSHRQVKDDDNQNDGEHDDDDGDDEDVTTLHLIQTPQLRLMATLHF